MQHNINNVEALWPRINKTYKFDSAERKSVPCPATDPMAAYEMSFLMTPDQAKELWGKMVEAYNAKKEAGWPEGPINPFKKDESGCFIAKAKLKGNYNGEPTRGVAQYDAKGNKLADDFMLTTGSKVNVALTFVPYNMREAGVSLRLRAVQVVEYKEMQEQNPFGQVDGYTSSGVDGGTSSEFDTNIFWQPAPAQAQAAPSTPVDPFGLPPVKPSTSAPVDLEDEIPF